MRLGAAVLCLTASGCAWWKPNPYAETAKCHLPPDTPELDVVRFLNARAERISGWRSMSARVVYRGPEGSHSLSATLAVQAPRNFSLSANSVMGPEVELGSNDDRFWFWAKRAEHHRVLMVAHEDVSVCQHQLPIPFQPDWLMEALGVVPMEETGVRVEECPPQRGQGRRVWLVSDRTSPQGDPIKKVVLVDACHGLPLKHELIDQQDRRIATATLSHWRADRKTGEPVPGTIALEWPARRMSITITLNDVDVNPSIPEQAFAMPDYPSYPVLDLGRVAHADGSRPHHDAPLEDE